MTSNHPSPWRAPLKLKKGFFALSLLLLLSGCESGADAPAPTIGAPPKRSVPERAPESAPPEEPIPEESVDEGVDAPSPLAPTELPEGTADQQEKMNLARAAFLSDRYEIAEGLFAELAKDKPVTGTTVSAAIALAQIFIETDRPDRALSLLKDVSENAKDIPEVLLVIARVYRQLDQPAQALQTFDRALQVQPNYIFIYTEMAQIFFEQDDPERAQQLLLGYERQLELLARALEDPEESSEEERIYLIDIFAMIQDERAHQALIKALEDPAPQVRALSAQALGELAVPEAKEALERMAIEDTSELVRPAARQALLAIEGR